MFDNDYSSLIVSGSPTELQLHYAWNDVFTDYCRIIQSSANDEIFLLHKEINALAATIELINCACVILEIDNTDKSTLSILKKLGLNSGKKLDVKLLRSKAGRFEIELKQKMKDYEEKITNHVPATRDTFYEDLNAVCHVEGYFISADAISAGRFFMLLVSLKERAEKEAVKQRLKIA